jgi:hypothetical protein
MPGPARTSRSGVAQTRRSRPFTPRRPAPARWLTRSLPIPWGVSRRGLTAAAIAPTCPAPASPRTASPSTPIRRTRTRRRRLIGTTFGAGDGTSTFNLPNPASRVPLYAGTGSGLTARARGQAGGEEAHILSESEGPIGWVGDDRGNQATSLPLSLGDGYFTLEINTGGGGHNNMPPFIVLGPAIIRVL